MVVLAVLLARDWISAAIVLVTLPLIPLMMALVGATTRDRMDAQVRNLQRLGGHFLDVVAGLPTLKVFGRAKPQAAAIATVGSAYREQAVGTLRIAFLSSLVLELLASLAMALVAVAIGLRALNGSLDLETALFVLVLAPEAYLPLRRLGESYHAGAEGAAAATQILDALDEPLRRARDAHGDHRGPARGRRPLAPPGARRAVADRRARRGGGDRRPERMREVDAPAGAARARDARGGRGPRRRHGPARARPRGLARPPGLGSAAPAPVRGDDRRERPARPPGRARRSGLAGASPTRTSRRRSPRGPTACRRSSATTAPACRPANASASRSRARSCATRRCCCSTSRAPGWTARPRPRSCARSDGSCRDAPRSSSRTARRCSRVADRVVDLARAEVAA